MNGIRESVDEFIPVDDVDVEEKKNNFAEAACSEFSLDDDMAEIEIQVAGLGKPYLYRA
eukprot:m.114691 g.114691  ORF g.114691 m.114691 type:complete len:59 (+) comp37519_c0_seq3:305-481(+)